MNPQTILGMLILAVASAADVGAEDESITWFTQDGGGGSSSGDVFSLSGTLGQPDAGGPLAGGGFLLTGGFWSLQEPETSGATPTLAVTFDPAPAGGEVTISWAPALGGYILQESPEVAPTRWTDVANGTLNPKRLPTDSAARYFRLRRL